MTAPLFRLLRWRRSAAEAEAEAEAHEAPLPSAQVTRREPRPTVSRLAPSPDQPLVQNVSYAGGAASSLGASPSRKQ